VIEVVQERWVWPNPIIVSRPSEDPVVTVESPQVTRMLERIRRRAIKESRK